MKKLSLFFTAVAVSLLPVSVYADNVKFNNPQVDGYGLDHCREWNENCGMPAAQAFCQSKGYPRAVDFKVNKNNPQTRVINGGQVCDAQNCDRITQVVCQTEAPPPPPSPQASPVSQPSRPKVRTYHDPQVGDYGLDYCREWARHCGMPAAIAFCESEGYTEVINFAVHKGNKQKTRAIHGGQICKAPACDRITKVTCR